jgi:hypothetical protein
MGSCANEQKKKQMKHSQKQQQIYSTIIISDEFATAQNLHLRKCMCVAGGGGGGSRSLQM